ncbi:MAG: hypothetical protein ACRDT2_04545 [Natronosporangium sp.]
MRELHEYHLAELRDDIVEYEQKLAEAEGRGNEYSRKTYEQRLAETRASLARAEARQLPV